MKRSILLLALTLTACGQAQREGAIQSSDESVPSVGLAKTQSLNSQQTTDPQDPAAPAPATYIYPVAIEFVHNHNHPYPPPVGPIQIQSSPAPDPMPLIWYQTFFYRLDLKRFAVVETDSRAEVYRLTRTEIVELIRILRGTIIADYGNGGNACSQPYASIVASTGVSYELQVGCGLDLYKILTRREAGLREWLQKLADKIVTSSVPDPLAFGKYPLSSLSQLVFSRISNPKDMMDLPRLSIDLRARNSQIRVSYGDGSWCLRDMKASELAELTKNLTEAQLTIQGTYYVPSTESDKLVVVGDSWTSSFHFQNSFEAVPRETVVYGPGLQAQFVRLIQDYLAGNGHPYQCVAIAYSGTAPAAL